MTLATRTPALRAALPHAAPSIAAVGHVDPIYLALATELVDAAGYHLTPGASPAAPAVVFDGPGTGALAWLLERPWRRNRSVAVFTLHSHPIWHAALAATGAHVTAWPDGHLGLALALRRANDGVVRQGDPGVLARGTARVVAHVLLGMTDEAIGAKLGIATKTVTEHVRVATCAACDTPGTTARANPGSRNRRATLLVDVLSAYYTGHEPSGTTELA